MEADLAKCLDDAADLIEREGLVKRAFHIAGEGYCVIGALRAVCPEMLARIAMRDQRSRTDNLVAELLGFKYIGEVFLWNDTEKRTKQQVVERLRAGARKWESREVGGLSSETSAGSG